MEEQFEQLITAINAANVPTFLDWAPIILSVISVFAAIYIPWRIAQKQNRISIFDKLYAAYSELLLVKSFAIAISEYKFDIEIEDALRNRELFLVHFETAFGYHPDVSDIIACKEGVGSATAALRKNEMQSYMIPIDMLTPVMVFIPAPKTRTVNPKAMTDMCHTEVYCICQLLLRHLPF